MSVTLLTIKYKKKLQNILRFYIQSTSLGLKSIRLYVITNN
jgi:hypothetical protein